MRGLYSCTSPLAFATILTPQFFLKYIFFSLVKAAFLCLSLVSLILICNIVSILDESRKQSDAILGSEPYKRLKESPEISSPRAIIRLEGLTSSPLEATMKPYSEKNTKEEETAKSANLNEEKKSKEKERMNVDNFESRIKSENKTNSAQNQRSHSKNPRKAPELFSKQSTQQQQNLYNSARQNYLPPELKSDRVLSALIRSTPHIKFNGSHYDNHIILVLPSSLF